VRIWIKQLTRWYRADRHKSESRIQEYAQRTTDFPPIEVRGRELVDGHHRVAAALLRGDETILAVGPVDLEIVVK